MKKEYEILGINENASMEDIKKRYYEMVKKYPPERYSEEFIIINKSYNSIISESLKTGNELLFEQVIKSIVDQGYNKNKFYKCLYEFINIIDEKNFKDMNDKIIEGVIVFKESGYVAEALLLAFCAKKKFQDMELYKLADAYDKFEEFIIK